jgi:hypothetical protein
MRAVPGWGAHAPRVLVLAPSPKRTFPFDCTEKFMPARVPAVRAGLAFAREGACAPRKRVDASAVFPR